MMKQFLLTVLILICASTTVFAYDISNKFSDTIKESDKVSYKNQNWEKGFRESGFNFIKYYTTGTGGYSEYELNGKRYDTNTTIEFLYDNKLLGYNTHTMKFSYLTFNGKKFMHTYLTSQEIQPFFPNVHIIKVSDFKNNELTIKKSFLKKETYLLQNDTDEFFYKYSFENRRTNRALFKPLFSIRLPQTLVYSFWGSRNPQTPPLILHFK